MKGISQPQLSAMCEGLLQSTIRLPPMKIVTLSSASSIIGDWLSLRDGAAKTPCNGGSITGIYRPDRIFHLVIADFNLSMIKERAKELPLVQGVA